MKKLPEINNTFGDLMLVRYMYAKCMQEYSQL